MIGKLLALTATGAVVAAGGGAALASASGAPAGGSATVAAPSVGVPAGGSVPASTSPRARRAAVLGGRLEHGRLVIDTKKQGTVTVDEQAGRVTAVSATSVTVASTDGYTATYLLGPKTRVRAGNGPSATLAGVTTGESVRILARAGTGGADDVLIRLVVVHPKATSPAGPSPAGDQPTA